MSALTATSISITLSICTVICCSFYFPVIIQSINQVQQEIELDAGEFQVKSNVLKIIHQNKQYIYKKELG